MTQSIRSIALGLFVAVLSIGIAVAALSNFIMTMNALQVAAWIVSCAMFFVAGLCVWRVTAIRHEVKSSDVINVTPQAPQLPAPTYFQSAPQQWTRTDRVDVEAHRVAQLLRDAGAQPTRDALETHGGVFGHEKQRAIVAKWTSWGWCTEPRQGQPGRWKNE